MREYDRYGLDCQSRRSKSCVVNDGLLSTEVLRVAIGYRGTRSMVFRFCFRSKRNGVRTPPTSEERVRGEYIRAHFSEDFQQCDHNRKDLCFKHCISTSDCCCDHLWTTSLCACAHFVDTVDYYMNVVSLTPEV